MRRVLGAVSIFAGWLCLWLSAILGVVASESFGLDHVEGALPPAAVYGIPGTIIVWVLVGAAILTAVPIVLAIFAADASRPLYGAAATMAIAGVVMIPDELGRAFATGLLCGAGFLGAGAYLTHAEALAQAAGTAGARPGLGAPPTTSLDSGATVSPSAVPEVSPATAGASAKTAGTPAAPPPATSAPARSRKPSGRASRSASDTVCPWCSARIPAGADSCPSCHATLDRKQTVDALSIPGLTEVSPALRDYAERAARTKKGPGLWSLLTDADTALGDPVSGPIEKSVLEPPSPAVRAEMARIDREIAGELPTSDTPDIVAGPDGEPAAPNPTAAPESMATPEPPAAPAAGAAAAPPAQPVQPAPSRRRKTP